MATFDIMVVRQENRSHGRSHPPSAAINRARLSRSVQEPPHATNRCTELHRPFPAWIAGGPCVLLCTRIEENRTPRHVCCQEHRQRPSQPGNGEDVRTRHSILTGCVRDEASPVTRDRTPTRASTAKRTPPVCVTGRERTHLVHDFDRVEPSPLGLPHQVRLTPKNVDVERHGCTLPVSQAASINDRPMEMPWLLQQGVKRWDEK